MMILLNIYLVYSDNLREVKHIWPASVRDASLHFVIFFTIISTAKNDKKRFQTYNLLYQFYFKHINY